MSSAFATLNFLKSAENMSNPNLLIKNLIFFLIKHQFYKKKCFLWVQFDLEL